MCCKEGGHFLRYIYILYTTQDEVLFPKKGGLVGWLSGKSSLAYKVASSSSSSSLQCHGHRKKEEEEGGEAVSQ